MAFPGGGGNLGGAKQLTYCSSLPIRSRGQGSLVPCQGLRRGGAPRMVCSGCLSSGTQLVRDTARLEGFLSAEEGSWAAELVQRPPSLSAGPGDGAAPVTPSAHS